MCSGISAYFSVDNKIRSDTITHVMTFEQKVENVPESAHCNHQSRWDERVCEAEAEDEANAHAGELE